MKIKVVQNDATESEKKKKTCTAGQAKGAMQVKSAAKVQCKHASNTLGADLSLS